MTYWSVSNLESERSHFVVLTFGTHEATNRCILVLKCLLQYKYPTDFGNLFMEMEVFFFFWGGGGAIGVEEISLNLVRGEEKP